MLILLDIGNTSVTYGLYGNGRLHDFGSSDFHDIPYMINNWSHSGRLEKENYLVLSSVVPHKTRLLKKKISHYKDVKRHIKPLIVGQDLRISVPHRYESLKKLGSDRLVNLYGALRIYKTPILVIDFGTAVTFDVLSKNGVFEGGLIVPGPEVSLKTLTERAALLPSLRDFAKLKPPFPGRNTRQCLSRGILEGYGSMTDGLVSRFKSKYGNRLRVLATGGLAPTIKHYSRSLQIVDLQHTIKSLLIIFKDWKSGKLTSKNYR